ncbi:MAG TPA: hypothetical protein ENG63_01980 [Candidatus Desulfofervidus auxilii]|uniref:Endonuclease MutS2 n=1 Tax=Desulfofervidus auxilii TaxID=1621989 RepID=A0A7C0U1Q5_DESA2|nr:hypothetical protein [Candidatus Desulfofervidus auxilii]
MDLKTLQDLEFNHFLELITNYAVSNPGKNEILTLRPINSLSLLKERFQIVKEIKSRLWDKNFPFPKISNISSLLAKVKIKDFFLSPEEIYVIGEHLDIAAKIYHYWEEHQKECPTVFKFIHSIQTIPSLQKKIKQSVNAQGEILDTASLEIKKIRLKIKQLKAKIKAELDSILHTPAYRAYWQEKIISIRQGRYVVSVKSEFQPFLKGIIHDYSRSRATCFIEPFEILPFNNQLQMLIKEEEEEKKKILIDLTKTIANEINTLLNNQKILAKLDALTAIAQYAIEFDGTFPKFSDQIYFKKAYHPLLLWQEKKENQKKVVSIDLKISPPTKLLIISGPNAGGKTVALKTLGLFILMLQAGIPVPAEEAYFPIFEHVFSDIGDEQMLVSGMSTFSAHLKRLQNILEKIKGRTLILIDEIGKGTHPSEGIALGMSFLDEFKAKGAITVVTTHHDILKVYGLKDKEALNVAVGIDTKSLTPTYQLIYNTVGMSCALEIAEKLGVERQILEKAKNYLGKSEKNYFLSELIKLKNELETRKNLIFKLFSSILFLKERWENIIRQIEEKGIDKLLSKIEQTIKSVQQKKEDLEILKMQRQALKELKNISISSFKEPLKIKPGDWVKLSNRFGQKIAQVKWVGEDKVEVIIGNWRCQIPKNEIKEIVKKAQVLHKAVNVHTLSAPVSEIYLLGKKVDEALTEIEKAIDIAVLYGLKQMRIIHGLGSGRLRTAIQNYLKVHPQVAGFRDGHAHEGGQGVTIVDIRH